MNPYEIQQAINAAIAAPDYNPPLPQLEEAVWKKVFDWKTNGFSNDCLEWLGDGLMYAAISVELYRQIPNGTPDMFTKVRGPIVTNHTFALLTNKMNLSSALIQPFGVPLPTSPTSKCFADLFEVLPAEIYLRGGFDVLRQWVGQVFAPLITAAVAEYQRQRGFHGQKRKREDDPNYGRLCHTELVNKRLKTSHDTTGGTSLRERIFPIIHPIQRPVEFKALPLVYSRPAQVPNPALRALPAVASGSAPSKPPMNGPTQDPRKAAKKPIVALSEISSNTPGSSKVPPRAQVTKQGNSVTKAAFQNTRTTHSAAWAHALSPASGLGPFRLQHSVLSSPSRYISAAPSAPACGPGSSRFDPIVIEDEDEDKSNGTQATPHEVIELLDDDGDESDPELQQVEDILITTSGVDPAKNQPNAPKKV